MTYVFHFGEILNDWPDLVLGAWLTIRLSAMAMGLGLIVAIVCALGKTMGPRPVRLMVDVYVEVIRNSPFLVQIFLIFFGLPRAGIRLDANVAALIALTVNLGAYATEIVRAGIETIHKGQIEAGLALGLKPLQIFTKIVLFPALKAIYPSLTSQFILLMLTSSVVSAISAEELTAIANNLQAQTFRSFEIYIIVTLMYLAMSLMFSGLFAIIYKLVFARTDIAR